MLYFVGPALNVWVALYRARVAGGMAFLRLLSHVRTGRVRHRLRPPYRAYVTGNLVGCPVDSEQTTAAIDDDLTAL